MRRYGLMMALVGVLGFFYASDRMEKSEPVPPGISLSEYTRYPGGRWELARFALGGLAAVGTILALFPEGR